MTFDCDGFLLGPNPSQRGGGFTVVDESGRLVVSQTLRKPNFTNNEAELWAVAAALTKAGPGDVVRTDAQTMLWWVNSGVIKSFDRRDLMPLCRYAHGLLINKECQLVWIPRHENLAGIYNEQHHP